MQFRIAEHKTVPTDKEIRELAVREYADNECEIDDNAIVSIGEGPDGVTGAWVASWVWVDFDLDDEE